MQLLDWKEYDCADPEHDISSGEASNLIASLINDIRRIHPELWQFFLCEVRTQLVGSNKQENADRLNALMTRLAEEERKQTGEPNSLEERSAEDTLGEQTGLNKRLEQVYEDLQNNLMEFRHAVALAIATERQLEQQMVKNSDQSEIWANRARMAGEQNNFELKEQAEQRRKLYADAAAGLTQTRFLAFLKFLWVLYGPRC